MINRPEALRVLADHYADQPIVVTLGVTVREMLAVAGRRPNHLISLDAMGQAPAIGLGIALGVAGRRSGERVVVAEGDGSLLMGFTTMATIGQLRPENLVVVVFDNGVYLATGGQVTSGPDVDIVGVALACGWEAAREVSGDLDAFREALAWSDGQTGPILLRVRVGTETVPSSYFLEDPVVLGREFQDWLLAERGA